MNYFSIITPLFNTSKWIEDCVNSVLFQTFDKWELILVDDGSTDDSWKTCESFKNLDNRIKFIKQENQGVVAARYNGFLASSGDFILFLDSDDMLRPEALEEIANEMTKESYDLLRFGFDYCDLNWNSTKTVLPPLKGGVDQRNLLINHHEPLKQYSSPSIWDKAYARELAEIVFSLTKDRRIRHSEDMLFSLTALVLSRKTLFIQKSLYCYLQRPGSAIHALNPNSIYDKESYIDGLNSLRKELPNEFQNRIDELVDYESNSAVRYVLDNSSYYSLSYLNLCQLLSKLRKSTFYRKNVLLKSLHPKYLIRDLLLCVYPVFAIILMIKVKLVKFR